MKTICRQIVQKSRYGKIVFSNHELEPHERDTIFCLASFGFDIETIVPSNVPNSKNPDLLMLGTYWEMKGPRTPNITTIHAKFRKAKKQSNGRAIFDLRNIAQKDYKKVEKYIIGLFQDTREMRRIIIIKNDNNLIDIIK